MQVVDADVREAPHQLAGRLRQTGPGDDECAQVGAGAHVLLLGATGDQDMIADWPGQLRAKRDLHR